MSHKKNYCTNCGKFGHGYKNCSQPITSVGILCFNFDKSLNLDYHLFQKFIEKKYLKIDNFNFEHLDNITKINYFKNKIKFLLVRRKFSLNYVEFIRGKYDIKNLEKMIKMFELMTNDELNMIKNNDFTTLWNNLWNETAKLKIYQKEYKKSKKMFETLKNNSLLSKLLEISPIYDTPEWEIPKGKRNYFEKNVECAIREFTEETNLSENEFIILNNLFSVQENYTGTNGLEYKHIYYLSISDLDLENKNEINNNEIAEIKWFSWEDSVNVIRSYYNTKVELINNIFLFAMNVYIELYGNNNMYLEI